MHSVIKIAYMSVSFQTSLEICIRRNAERVSSVPEGIIHRMNSRFQWPCATISPWERYSLVLSSSMSDAIVEEVEGFVESVLKQPLIFIDWEKLEAERNMSREANKMNPLHIVDDVLRSLVNACINSLSRSSNVSSNS
nr:l seryl trna(sec) kinase [Hymenolepis microstoma]